MSYKPKTEEQLQKEGLLPDGIYDFQIVETESAVSKKGNDMFVFKQNVYGIDGSTHPIRTWITFGNNYGERMFRHAADSCGLIEEYTAGTLKHEDFLNRSGKCEVNQRQDDKLTWWNGIKDYVKRGEGSVTEVEKNSAPKKSAAADLNDEIPF